MTWQEEQHLRLQVSFLEQRVINLTQELQRRHFEAEKRTQVRQIIRVLPNDRGMVAVQIQEILWTPEGIIIKVY